MVDALMLPNSFKVGNRITDRANAVSAFAEPLLGTDYASGQRAWIRKMPHERMFITNSMDDTLYFPTGHPRSGQPRYVWKRQEDGSEHGFLVEGASDAAE